VQSFIAFPVGPEPFAFLRSAQPQLWGAEIFKQMNVFAIGFPITLAVGLLGLLGMLLPLPLMNAPFTMALERMLTHFQ
jgi:flagellar biosynthetic protein FliR